MRRFSVKSLYLFGSVARGGSKEGSDVDILVEYELGTRVGLFQFVRLRRELSNILGCEVDLATPDSLHKELRDDILKEAVHAA
jgi:predicted nucleotidyltransferase